MAMQRSVSMARAVLIIAVAAILAIATALVILLHNNHRAAANRRLLLGLNDGSTKKTYTTPDGAYSFSYPASWKIITSPDGVDVTTLTYMIDGKTYRLTISPPGQINPEGVLNISTQVAQVSYGSMTYTRTLWSENGKPFYITAVPIVTADQQYYVLAMAIPNGATSDYLSALGMIATSLHYN